MILYAVLIACAGPLMLHGSGSSGSLLMQVSLITTDHL
jgi:hypothetical protein